MEKARVNLEGIYTVLDKNTDKESLEFWQVEFCSKIIIFFT
jgi:hypothetical protein